MAMFEEYLVGNHLIMTLETDERSISNHLSSSKVAIV